VGNEDNPLPNLQVLLDQAVFEMAYELPSRAEGCAGKPPIQAHPDLLQPRRTFCAQEELAQFDLQRVDAYLASFTWQRKVSRTGQICIGGHHHYYTVGHAYAGSTVLVRFDPADRHFVFFELTSPEKEVGRRPARHLSVEDLTGFATFPQGLFPQQLPLPLFQKAYS
jgi:hypothetical protein